MKLVKRITPNHIGFKTYHDLIIFILCLFLCNIIYAQKDYSQQQVNYKIDVQLDDSLHILTGMIDMEYINNSPDELTEIYMHLWPNAYSNKETAFAQQQLQQKSTKFYYAKKKDLGGFSRLDFLVDGNAAKWEFDEKNVDIALIQLSKPLASGSSVKISTPFSLKIPTSFSRLGHVETSYQITQWYPKPAVYDHKGWHPMPYLDMGEFYSEFGDFDVSITLPYNYVVGATGTLNTESEKEFLATRMKATQAYLEGNEDVFPPNNGFPKSSKKLKTLRFTAENIHDFGWFADKRFRVIKDEVELNSGKKVDTWVMFTEKEEELWKDAIAYVNRAVKFYSDHVGEYPYPQATAVQSALSAGGGMEYPMITVIGLSNTAKALDDVITHEVGHNWFYGILASNERIHPWMDEGMNSYYEYRYMDENYDQSSALLDVLPKFLIGKSEMGMEEAGYLWQARRNLDQAPDTPSDEMVYLNYGISAYAKPADALKHLEHYLGREKFDEAMQVYYETWKFKHPYPEDFRRSLEESTNKDLSWFFDGLLYSSKKIDYALMGVQKTGNQLQISVANKGEIDAPFPISAVKNGEVIATKWYEGISDKSNVDFDVMEYDDLVIDVDRVTLDVDRIDNRKRSNPLNINTLIQLEDDQKRNLSLFPSLAWNAYDGFMLGVGAHNKSIPFRNFEFAVTPMFGFSSQRLTGLGTLRYNIYPKTDAIERISLQLNGRTFSYNYNEMFDYHDYFTKIAPKLELTLGKKTPTSNIIQRISYRYINIEQDIGRFNPTTKEIARNEQGYAINELKYSLENSSALNPSTLSATLEQSDAFTKAFAHFNQQFPYQEEEKNLKIHLFGGYFFNFDASKAGEAGVRPSFLLSGNTTNTFQQDYLFDEVLFGRSETEGLLRYQIFDKDAGFKTITSTGSSNNWMLSGGMRSTLPGAIPLEIFADGAYSVSTSGEGDFLYSTGFIVPIFKSVFEIYIPVLESNAINVNHNVNGREGLLERITFRLDLTKLNLFEVLDEFELN